MKLQHKGTQDNWNIFRQDDDIYIEAGKRVEVIASIMGGVSEEEDEANAKLITAVPALLEQN